MTSPSSPKPRVAIIMGSDSDFPVMKQAADALSSLDIAFELKVVSAHRTPQEMAQFAEGARNRGIQVIIAGAGGAAHLPGMVAAHTPLPVIGVPVPIGYKQGEDALWSIVQMPKGVPVATVAIGGAYNAGLLAAQICGFGGAERDHTLEDKLQQLKVEMRQASLAKVVSYPESS